MIQMTPVKSSQLASVGYDPATQTLAIIFTRGTRRYDYVGVPQNVADGLAKAESPGRFFGASIRGAYEFEVVDIGPIDEAQAAQGEAQ